MRLYRLFSLIDPTILLFLLFFICEFDTALAFAAGGSHTALRTGLDSAYPYNPVPEKRMAEEGNFLSESTSSAVGSRRSRAAAFGDKTSDDIFASAGRGRGRGALEVEGVLTSSSATTVGNGGEQYHMTPTS